MKRKVFAVIGLGEYGTSVALSMARQGCEVMAIDINGDKVQAIADEVTQAIRADGADLEVVSSLGLGNMDAAVIAIGNNLEASIMATIAAKECGVPFVLVKAATDVQATVLKRIGADKIIFPERAMGARTARNLMAGGFLDLVELSQKFSMAEIEVPAAWDGKTLRQLDLRKRALNMIAKKSGEEVIMQLDPDVPLKLGEKYIIVGTNEMLETLSARR